MAKNDDAAADTLLWDDAAVKPPADWENDVGLLIIGQDSPHASSCKLILESLRDAQKKRYKKTFVKALLSI